MDRNNKVEILYVWQGLVQYVTVKQQKEAENNTANSNKIRMDLMWAALLDQIYKWQRQRRKKNNKL